MRKFCKVCVVDHPLAEFATIQRGRRTATADYCIEMAALKPYQRLRIRLRNEDEAAFLRNNAERMKTYRDAHPEIGEAYNEARRKDPSARMRNCVINHATQKGISVCKDEIPAMTVKLSQPCNYCGHDDFSWTLNGLDRIDSRCGYTDANTVACCDVCNYMKLDYSLDAFLEKTTSIVLHNRMENSAPGPKATITFGQSKSKGGFRKRSPAVKTMHLTFLEQQNILSRSCHYCGTNKTVGMDRVDSELPYTVQNVVACCTMCNYMKKDKKPAEFLNQCLRIFVYVSI